MNKEKVIFKPTEKDGFVGIQIEKEMPSFYFPKELEEAFKNNPKNIIKFLRTLSIAQNNIPIYKMNLGNDEPIDSLIWVIQDYLLNGFKQKENKETKAKAQGKINWKKTLKNSSIFYTGNSLVFNEIYSEKSFFYEDELFKIHQYCLNYACERLGWIFDFYYSEKISINLKKSILFLSNLLSKSFLDSLRIKLLHLKKILVKASKEKETFSNLPSLGLNHYHSIYEYMLKTVISRDNYDESIIQPQGYWIIEGNRYKMKRLRPDFIYESSNSDEVVIFDAKFYRPTNGDPTLGLPQSSDIQKQIIYGKHIKNIQKYKNKKIYSSFILPCQSTNRINFYGKTFLENMNEFPYETIVCLTIDLFSLIDTFLSHKKISCLEFMDTIVKNSNQN